MAITEPVRHRLHDGLKEAIGDDNAGALMQMLPPYSWEEIARRSDLREMRVSIEGKLDAMSTRIDGVETKIDGVVTRIDGVETRIDGVETKIDSSTAMIEAIGVAINGRVDRLFGKLLIANLGITISISGLLLAAIQLGTS